MKTQPERYPLNVPGPFYVENGICIICRVPEHEAPDLIGFDADPSGTGHCCLLHHSPATSIRSGTRRWGSHQGEDQPMSDRTGVILTETQLLCRRLGDRVREVYRTCYLFQGELDRTEGDLTFVFESGFVLRLTGASSGEDLVVQYDRWEGPFAEPLDETDREWVEQYGKWTEVCVNEEDDYRPVIGNPLVGIRHVFSHYERRDEWKVGLSFHFSPDAVLFLTNDADTVRVTRTVDPNKHSERPLCSLTAG